MSERLKIIDVHTHLVNSGLLALYGHNFSNMLCITHFDGFANGAFAGCEDGLDDYIAGDDRLYLIQCIDINKDIAAQLSDIQKKLSGGAKIRGVKFYVGYQHFYPSDPRLDVVYDFCADNGLVAVFHSGSLLDFENSPSQLKYAHPAHVDEVASRFLRTKFVISHLGFPHILETFCIVSKNVNVYTDISGTLDCPSVFDPYVADIKRAIAYYPDVIDKLMFGTDFGPSEKLREVDLYVKTVEAVFEKPEDRGKVFYENAKKLYRL
jgi:Predicted metal-dependent hydrolase of the TIM-barrel fold